MRQALIREALKTMHGAYGPEGAHLIPTVDRLGENPEYGVVYDYRTVNVLVVPCCTLPAAIVGPRTQVFDPIYIPALRDR
jgi:hypothetical protein